MAFARVFRMLDEQSDLMGRMLDTLGIRQPQCSDLQSARDLREAAQNCVHCRASPECRAWLDEQDVIGQTSDPTFCPNYERFQTWEKTKR